jgi:hypothetical protein
MWQWGRTTASAVQHSYNITSVAAQAGRMQGRAPQSVLARLHSHKRKETQEIAFSSQENISLDFSFRRCGFVFT